MTKAEKVAKVMESKLWSWQSFRENMEIVMNKIKEEVSKGEKTDAKKTQC